MAGLEGKGALEKSNFEAHGVNSNDNARTVYKTMKAKQLRQRAYVRLALRDLEWAFHKLRDKKTRIRGLQQKAAGCFKNALVSQSFRKWLDDTREIQLLLWQKANPAPTAAEKRMMKTYEAPGAPNPCPERVRTPNQLKKDNFNAEKVKKLAPTASYNSDFFDYLFSLTPLDRACALLLCDHKVRQKYLNPRKGEQWA